MATERKDERNMATQDRYQTGNAARDEQTQEALQANKQLNEGWHQTKDALKQDFNALTEEDLELKPGKEQETINRIGKRLKKTPEEAGRLVRDTAKRFQHPVSNRSAATAGVHTPGTHKGHMDMPEAAERKARRDEVQDGKDHKH